MGALAATLVGCSRQLPPQAATGICPATKGFACLERTVGPPMKLASFRIKSTAGEVKSASVRKTKSSSADARHGARLSSKTSISTTKAAKAGLPASRVTLPTSPPTTRPQPPGNVAATESSTTHVNLVESHPTAGHRDSNTRTIEAQVAAATALADRMTVATAASDIRANDGDGSRDTEKLKSPSANDTDLLVAVLMARPETKSVSDLTGKTIAIDDRYSASNGGVRAAIVAAGATEVQLSEGQTTAINRLVNGEVPAAVLALVSAEAAMGFPEIAGFKTFHIPLSLRALKVRP
jgi:hypothetical protein